MDGSDQPLQLYEVGHYGELSSRRNPSGYVVLTSPDFDSMLPFIEMQHGQKLTLEEIEAERKNAPAIVLLKEEAERMMAVPPRNKKAEGSAANSQLVSR